MFNNILKAIWNSYCNALLAEQWGGAIGGGGGQHYKPSVVGGGGVDFEMKIWQWGSPKK